MQVLIYMKNYDVVVVGGGPVGGFVAKFLAKKQYSIAILEEHEIIGKPLKCAGLVSPRVFDIVPFSNTQIVENTIKGAHIHSPSGVILTIGGDKKHAVAINRPLFDQKILDEAIKAGAHLQLKTKVIDAKKEKNSISLTTKNKKQKSALRSSIVIGADGPHSTIRKIFNFPKPKEYLKGIGALVENTVLDHNFVEIFLGKDMAPGFFAWAIPINKQGTKARIGLCVDDASRFSIKKCFQNLLEQPTLKDAKILSSSGGMIPLGPLKKTTSSNILLVGDAAGQVKPTSGGGIYTGLVSAKNCSNVALNALKKNDFSDQILKEYQTSWTDEIGRELTFGMKFRKIYKKLDDKQIDKYIIKLKEHKNIELLNKYGDIDFPSKLVFPLLKKNPSFLKILPTALKIKIK
ncbi:MAG: geranylgeranyl reductase family protein [Thermoplasmatota archaeon]